jgi:hypothetical protein
MIKKGNADVSVFGEVFALFLLPDGPKGSDCFQDKATLIV